MRSIKLPSWTERILGLEPRPVPPHVFSLEPRALAYGRFVRAESGFEVEHFSEAELPEGLFGEGPLGGPMHDPSLLKSVVRELVESVEDGIAEATLILPDAWLRLAFTEMEDMPRKGSRRDEVLRWKLKRQVPFRVEELRIEGVEVERLPSQPQVRRLLVAFAIDRVLCQLEDAFLECGIRVGRVLNASLAAVDSVQEVIQGLNLAGLVLVSASGYSLTFAQSGVPLLHRFRALDSGIDGDAAARLVQRDLSLTQTFVSQQLPAFELERVLLVSQPGQKAFWLESLEQGLGHSPVALGREQLPLRGQLPEISPALLAPMVGAACAEFS